MVRNSTIIIFNGAYFSTLHFLLSAPSMGVH
nr:MAG TPA: hypothetical protein [Caudoviricetes sp.]